MLLSYMMMTRQDGKNTVDEKALQINLDATKYGTFAEIGAGQEVARQFFHVGGASGTIAKTISAYDMTFSDAIYGPCPRYVSRQRLYQMLEYEYNLLIERLADKRAGRTSFFAFANTVAARAFNHPSESHGWMGIRYQAHPRAEPNQIIIHIRMLDKENIQQQEALGIIGVNLIHSAFYLYQNPDNFIGALLDGLTVERIQVDIIKFTGPDFHYVDNRLMALQLVEQGLSDAAMFTADGEVVRADDTALQESGARRARLLPAADQHDAGHSRHAPRQNFSRSRRSSARKRSCSWRSPCRTSPPGADPAGRSITRTFSNAPTCSASSVIRCSSPSSASISGSGRICRAAPRR